MRALITGVYGQDGSYLCEQLRDQGYEVHGICHSVLSDTSKRKQRDLLDYMNLCMIMMRWKG